MDERRRAAPRPRGRGRGRCRRRPARIRGRRPRGTPDLGQRLLRGGEAEALTRPAGQRLQPLQGQGQVRAALVADQGVDLVHDHGARRGQHRAAAVGGQQEVQGLRRGDQDVRRPLRHRRALAGRRVAGAHEHAHLGQGRVQGADLRQRALQVLLDVVGRAPAAARRRRPGSRGARSAPCWNSASMAERNAGQRLARAGGGRDQDVAPVADERPAFGLGRGRLPEAAREPATGRPDGNDRGHPRDPPFYPKRQYFPGAPGWVRPPPGRS